MKVPGWLVPCMVFGGLIVLRILEVFAPKVLEQLLESVLPLLSMITGLICLFAVVYWGWCLSKWIRETKNKPGQRKGDILCLLLFIQWGFMALAVFAAFQQWWPGELGFTATCVFFGLMWLFWNRLKRREEEQNCRQWESELEMEKRRWE